MLVSFEYVVVPVVVVFSVFIIVICLIVDLIVDLVELVAFECIMISDMSKFVSSVK